MNRIALALVGSIGGTFLLGAGVSAEVVASGAPEGATVLAAEAAEQVDAQLLNIIW